MASQNFVFLGKDLQVDFLKNIQVEFSVFDGPKECIKHCKENRPTHIFCQMQLPLQKALKAKEQISKLNPYIIFVFIADPSEKPGRIEELEKNGHEYIVGPLSATALQPFITGAQPGNQVIENTNISQLKKKYEYFGIIGNSPTILRMVSQIDSISKNDGTVLIIGERGSGREIVAKAIHSNSSRSKGPFVEVSLSAIPEHCLDEELYGTYFSLNGNHEHSPNGFFSEAAGGSIFLDEIEKISLEAQAKMVHFLQTKLESNDSFSKPPFRIIATSSSPLDKLVNEGKFRYDLYYRINILNIFIPPLRERRNDIPTLIKYYLEKYSPNKPMHISPKAMELLLNHSWPGNVRQLENIIERITLTVSGNTVFDHNLPQEFRVQGNYFLDIGNDYCFETAISEVEKSILIKALTISRGNKKLAAKKLRLPYSTFRNKLLKLSIEEKDYSPESPFI